MQIFSIYLFLKDALHVSDGFSVHHQERKTAHRYWSDKYLTLYLQFRAPDIGQKNRLKHVERLIRIYIGFKTSFYVVRHLDSIASYLNPGLHLGLFRSWPSFYLPSSFSSLILVLSFVSASTSMLFWVIFLRPFFEHGRTM